MQRLERLRAKLTEPCSPNASPPDRKTESVANSTTHQPQELIKSFRKIPPASAASPGPSPAQTCPPAKKARRLVPSLSITGRAQEDRSSVETQKAVVHRELHEDPAPAAIHAALPSVFSFL